MKNTRTGKPALAIVLLFSAAMLFSQIRARVDLVVVPVSVRDNNGFLLTGLGQDDFTILEDGKRQTITNFSIDPQPLSAAIIVDDGVSANALKRLIPLIPSITGSLAPEDEVTSFRYDHLVSQLSDFTTDHKRIEDSFGELVDIAASRPAEPENPELYDKLERKTPGWIQAIAKIFTLGSIGAPSSGPSSSPPAPRSSPDSHVMHSAVFEAAQTLEKRPAERRKVIFLISDGTVSEPQTSVIPGRTLHSLNANVDLLLNDRIQVFAVNTLAPLLDASSGALDSYAQATGGDTYGGISDSDMDFALKRIVEQARTQYVLGYVSNNTAPPGGVFRNIEVKSGDPDQKRKVVYRKGYMQYPIPQ